MRFKAGILIVLALSLAFAASSSSQTETAIESGPMIRLKSAEIDLGDIDQDSTRSGSVKFYNDGTEPLVIKSVFTDCHCTVPSYTEHPVAPGDSGVIDVKFSTKGRSVGSFRKVVRIRSNAPHTKLLFVKGRVKRSYRK